MPELIKASSLKCSKCVEKAVAFWPVFDPDIRSYPYCRKCLDAVKERLLVAIMHSDKERESKRGRKQKISK